MKINWFKKKVFETDGFRYVNGASTFTLISIPSSKIVNDSFRLGEFPDSFKEARVTPILKKVMKPKFISVLSRQNIRKGNSQTVPRNIFHFI